MCSLTVECVLLLWDVFSYYGMCSLTMGCVLLLWDVFSYSCKKKQITDKSIQEYNKRKEIISSCLKKKQMTGGKKHYIAKKVCVYICTCIHAYIYTIIKRMIVYIDLSHRIFEPHTQVFFWPCTHTNTHTHTHTHTHTVCVCVCVCMCVSVCVSI